MKNTTFDSFLSVLEEMGHTFTRAMRFSLRALATISWPALLVACILLAMLISIVPLVLFLFVVFMAIKLISASIVQHKKRGPATPYRPADGEGE
jgi:hypothetical protein